MILIRTPQSNQRGIETQHPRVARSHHDCLNRTSVGLKPKPSSRTTATKAGLNRTSVGLKHGEDPDIRLLTPRLNRTSVGLKPGHPVQMIPQEERLNRTSVGLKREEATRLLSLCRGGLNRTSVGLKHPIHAIPGRWDWRPQSNQRGIETGRVGKPIVPELEASIEPAWD